MKALVGQAQAELRLLLRDKAVLLFSFFFPVITVAFFGYLNRGGQVGEISYASFLIAGGIGMVVSSAAFQNLSAALARQRDVGILKRLGGTPLRCWVFLTARALSATVIIFIEVALILAVGLISTDVSVAGNWWLLGLLLLGTFTTAALGFVLSNVTASADGAVVAVHAIYIPMLFLCGAFIPVEALPKILQVVARAIPLTYFVGPFRSVMVQGASLGAIAGDLSILLAWTVISWIVAAKTFRWQ